MSGPLERLFPGLAASAYRVTSPRTPDYNCIAYAAGDEERWWEPDEEQDHFWPEGARRAYTTIGGVSMEDYRPCSRRRT